MTCARCSSTKMSLDETTGTQMRVETRFDSGGEHSHDPNVYLERYHCNHCGDDSVILRTAKCVCGWRVSVTTERTEMVSLL